MNVLRVLRLAMAIGMWLVGARAAAAESPITVIMDQTTGPSAWLAAERRLTAELRGLQMRVLSGGIVTEVDADLPERVMRAAAFVGVQVLRDGDRGIIRFWFAPQRGQRSGYQHVEMNLRNADVVSRAVLPVVEAIFDRTQSSMQTNDSGSDRVVATADPCSGVGTPTCRAPFALHAGAGAFLAHADSGATTAVDLGFRVRLWPAARLELDAAYLFPGQKATGEQRHRQMTARTHLMFEGWSKDGRGAAIGPGLGLVSVSDRSHSALVPTASARASFFMPVSRQVNLVFGVTGARMLSEPRSVVANPWFADAMLALDWYVGM